MTGGVAAVHNVIDECLPCYRAGVVIPLGEGQDNSAFEVDGELIVRFRKDGDPSAVEREARLLETVAAVSPVPVPVPAFVAASYGGFGYRKLPGTPLFSVPRPADVTPIIATLAAFLEALHVIPAADLVEVDDQPLPEWLDEAAASYPAISASLPAVFRGRIERFLTTPPPPRGNDLAFSHNDLGIEHVLVDPATWAVTGIIDWTDAAIVDPAYDVGLLYRDLGPEALAGRPADFAERAAFYARCGVIEDMAYGGRYFENGVPALAWLFTR